jgi:hypothetical protein
MMLPMTMQVQISSDVPPHGATLMKVGARLRST